MNNENCFIYQFSRYNIMTTKPMQHLLNQEVTASIIDRTHLEPAYIIGIDRCSVYEG